MHWGTPETTDPAAPTDPGALTEPSTLTEPPVGSDLAGLGEALEAIGDRWSLLVIAALLGGPARFGELQQHLTAIAPNVLSQRLRALERRGLLVATPYSQRPPRYLYELTATGRELAGALRMLGDWGARNAGGEAPPAPAHDACGTALQVRWYCPACDEVLPASGEGEASQELYYA